MQKCVLRGSRGCDVKSAPTESNIHARKIRFIDLFALERFLAVLYDLTNKNKSTSHISDFLKLKKNDSMACCMFVLIFFLSDPRISSNRFASVFALFCRLPFLSIFVRWRFNPHSVSKFVVISLWHQWRIQGGG